jgi:hypothetical protein
VRNRGNTPTLLVRWGVSAFTRHLVYIWYK